MRQWFAIMLCVVAAGCIHYQPRPIVPSDSAAKLESRTLTSVDLRKFLETNLHTNFSEWPLPSWNFNRLTLAALYYNSSLQVSRAQLDISQAQTETAGERPNPVLTATPGYDFSATGGISPWIPAIGVDVPLETAGKRKRRMERSEHMAEAAHYNFISAAWQVRSNLHIALIDHAVAKKRQALLAKQIGQQREIVRVMDQRVAAGAMAASEVIANRVQLEKAMLDVNAAQTQFAESRARLAEALGIPLKALEGITIDFEFSRQDDVSTEAAWEGALTRRADILSLLAEYAASESTLRLEIAKQYPDIHLGPSYQFDQGDHKWSLAITAELPLLNQNQGPIAEATARRAEVAARLNDLQSRIIADIDHSTALYNSGRTQVAANKSLISAERKQEQSIESQIKAGASERLELMTVQLELSSSDLLQLESEAKMEQASAMLENAVQLPIANLNSILEQTHPLLSRKEQKP